MSDYELTGRKLDPVHVGSVLKELLEDYDISQSSLALHIGVTYPTLNDLCNEKKIFQPRWLLGWGGHLKNGV